MEIFIRPKARPEGDNCIDLLEEDIKRFQGVIKCLMLEKSASYLR